MTLLRRIETLEQTSPPGDPMLVLVTFIGARDGAPDGRRSDWDAHAECVVVNHERHPVAADETAEQAVRRIVAAMHPPPSAVVAFIPTGAQA